MAVTQNRETLLGSLRVDWSIHQRGCVAVDRLYDRDGGESNEGGRRRADNQDGQPEPDFRKPVHG